MNKDCYTVSDGDSLTFVERVSWSTDDTETELERLRHCMVVRHLVTIHGFYLVLLNMDPMEFNRPDCMYKLARVTTNQETGAVEIHSMNVTAGQVEQICRAGEWFE